MRYRDKGLNMLKGFAWIVSGLFFFQYSAHAEVPAIEREALVALYDSTNGAEWKRNFRWLNGDPCTNFWYGIKCDQNGNVTRVNLHHNKLNGVIPPELGNLHKLFLLDIGENTLRGAIPPELGKLENLGQLFLDRNALRGSIPTEIGNLVKLKLLSMYDNNFSGSLSPELGKMVKLEDLRLEKNQLSGSIPIEFSNLINLEKMYLHDNQLSGSIPSEIGRLIKLTSLKLNNNRLSGPIPGAVGELGNLATLLVNGNALTGEVPIELSTLTSVLEGQMDLRWNALYTADIALDTFLNTKSKHDWSASQTVAPENVVITDTSKHAATLTWDGIEYQGDIGRYRVLYSTAPGGPYMSTGTSTDKTATGLSVGGLPADSTLYFVVQTETDHHFDNPNKVLSYVSPELMGVTPVAPPGFFITPISDLITDEAGAIDTFEASLDVQPFSDVTIALASSDISEGTISHDSLTFTNADWDVPQLVTITGVDDDEADGHQHYMIVTGAASSTDIVYDGIDPVDVSVTNEDDGDITTAALEAIYNSAGGPFWIVNTNWLIGDPCKDNWYGVNCDRDANIIGIDLQSNGLRGTLPPDIGDLIGLRTLELSKNLNLRGPIPPEIGRLVNLREFTVIGAGLDGEIPAELGDLVSLTTLNLADTFLNGSIPPALGNLTSLVTLKLIRNRLSGFIPSELGNLANLQVLNLTSNFLDGSIPAEIRNLSSLRLLYLDGNQLSGSIPAEIGNLVSLETLSAVANRLSGSIPAETGMLINLNSLYLSYNQLGGPIPAELENLTNLQILELRSNNLSGPIPFELGNMTGLQYMNLVDNQLGGQIPSELENLTNLQDLQLNNNILTGPIPSELGNMTGLKYLRLNGNQLSGPIPVELSNMTSLNSIGLNNNQLNGPIPAELGNMTSLNSIGLSNNQLSGPIPAELGNLNKLSSLQLSNNQLSGSIPAELGNLGSMWNGFMWNLELNGNKLSGPIPTSLSNLHFESSESGPSSVFSLDWNALYTKDTDLIVFLNRNERNWSATQTIAPENVSVTNVGPDSVTFSWNSIEYTNDEGGYRIWYGTSSGGPYMDGGITSTKNDTTHTVTGLDQDQDYYFAVTTETNSHPDNTNLVISEPGNEVFVPSTLAKPTGIKATDGMFLNRVQVSFNPVTGATAYRVFRCLDRDQTCGSPIGYPTTVSFEDKNVVPGTVYYYRVRACIANTCGKFSPANTGFASIQLPKPTRIMATDGTYADRVHISWDGVSGASIYRVFRCLDTGVTCGSPIGFPQGTSFNDKLGAAGTVYQYRVKACNAQQCSKFSAANEGHRSDTPALKKDETNSFLLPGQQVPIPTSSDWSRWALMLMLLGVGLVLLHRQYPRNQRVKG